MMEFHYLPERGRGATGEPEGVREAGGSPASQRLARVGLRGRVAGFPDGSEEFVAGAADGLGGGEVGGCGGELVEGAEGDAGPEEGFGASEGPEV